MGAEGKKSPQRGCGVGTWVHDPMKGGGMRKGWIAGETRWYWVHFMGRSIPCYHEFTDGELDCPYCKRRPRVSEIGYVPYYDDTGRPTVVIVPEYASDQVSRLKLHQPVIVTRGKLPADPVFVRPDSAGRPYSATRSDRQTAADIRPWLLRLWKEEPLVDYFSGLRAAPAPPAPPPPAPPPPADDCGDALPPAVRVQWERAKRESAARSNDTPVSFPDMIPVPSANGKHRKG